MDNYKNLLYNFNNSYSKNINVLYELAMERGKKRGWYPLEWNLNDYINHILRVKQKDIN